LFIIPLYSGFFWFLPAIFLSVLISLSAFLFFKS
jgi:hypothetical protein